MTNKILVIILIIALSLLTLVLAIEENSYDLEYYTESFAEYKIEAATGKSISDLETIAKDIIDFLKGNDINILDKHFNQREILHMVDVLKLFDIARTIKLVSFVTTLGILVYLISRSQSRFTGKWMALGLFSNHIIFGLVTLLARADFTKYFIYFHEIFFDNELWILNPQTDLLIQMLPEPFFMNIAVRIGLDFIKYLAIAQFIGYVIFRKGDYGIENFKSNIRL